MRSRPKHIRRIKPPKPQTPEQAQKALWLAPLAACLAAGAGLGTFSFVQWGGGPDLLGYLNQIAYSSRFWLFCSLFFRQLFYLVPLFFCGYFHRGFKVAALLFALKGFFTARLATAFLYTYGGKGYAALWATCFLQSFCSILCMLLLGCHAMKQQGFRRTMLRSKGRLWRLQAQPEYDAVGLMCLFFCLVCSLAICLLAPSLSRAALALLS